MNAIPALAAQISDAVETLRSIVEGLDRAMDRDEIDKALLLKTLDSYEALEKNAVLPERLIIAHIESIESIAAQVNRYLDAIDSMVASVSDEALSQASAILKRLETLSEATSDNQIEARVRSAQDALRGRILQLLERADEMTAEFVKQTAGLESLLSPASVAAIVEGARSTVAWLDTLVPTIHNTTAAVSTACRKVETNLQMAKQQIDQFGRSAFEKILPDASQTIESTVEQAMDDVSNFVDGHLDDGIESVTSFIRDAILDELLEPVKGAIDDLADGIDDALEQMIGQSSDADAAAGGVADQLEAIGPIKDTMESSVDRVKNLAASVGISI